MIKDRNVDPNANIDPSKILGGLGYPLRDQSKVVYVDGDNGSDTVNGSTPSKAFKTIQAAVTAVGAWGRVYVFPKNIAATDTDPANYAEVITIPATHEGLQIIGVPTGRTQGGLPQIKIGSGSTAMITVRSAGCGIHNIGINGASSTGGGILLDDDGGSTKTAFGTTVSNCHFKNCVGTTATDSRTGGAIMWAAAGNAWQTLIKGNRFYKCVGDVVLKGTSGSVPQDVVIEDNVFSGPAANTDCNLYLAGGSGMNGVIIRDNYFTAMPAIGSGSVVRYVDLTGCVGLMANNYFASLTAATGSPVTFAAAGTGGKVPTTVFMAGNYGETTTAGETGEIIRT